MGSADGQASKNAVQSEEQACMHWKDLQSKGDLSAGQRACACLHAVKSLRSRDLD